MTPAPNPRTLITGAASGIGAALAEQLAGAGHSLVLVDIAATDHVAQVTDVTRLQGDVADESFWQRSKDKLQGVTHAVINAGVGGGATIAEMDFQQWRRIVSINLDGAFLTLQAALTAIRQSYGPRAIVFTSSIAGIKAEPRVSAYGASKAGVLQLMRVAAKEVAAEGIRVNAIAPGGVDTPIWDELPFFDHLVAQAGSREAAIAQLGTTTPLGRYATAPEIAQQIAFLLSDAAATITGATLTSDGGYSL